MQYVGTPGNDARTGTGQNDSFDGYGGDDSFSGLGGNDYIIGGDNNDTLDGGAGNDTIYGQTGIDTLRGDADSDWLDGGDDADVLEGGAGTDFLLGGYDVARDVLRGGDGSDWFYRLESNDAAFGDEGDDSFYLSNFNGRTGVTIDGGSGYDVFYSNVPLHELSITWVPTPSGDKFEIRHSALSGPITLTGVERVDAREVTVNEENRTGAVGPLSAITNHVTPVDHQFRGSVNNPRSIAAEAMALAYASYGWFEDGTSNSKIGKEPFDEAKARGWHPLSALELGIPGGGGALDYTMQQGFFTVETTAAHGVALVMLGELHGKPTLAIAFRGTDEDTPEYLDYESFDQTYGKFSALTTAVRAFAAANGIQDILLTGHSLGASMAQTALVQSFADFPGAKALLFASPGMDAATVPDSVADRITAFDAPIDLIPYFGDAAGAAPLLGGLLAAIDQQNYGALSTFLANKFGEPVRHLPEHLIRMRDKIDVGSVVKIEVDGISLWKHDQGIYVERINALVDMAHDNYNSAFYASAFAQTIREGRPWSDGSLIIVLGNDGANAMHVSLADYVATGFGEDSIAIWGNGNPGRVVDGGRGEDRVYLPAGSYSFVPITENGVSGYRALRSGEVYGTFFDIEQFDWGGGDRYFRPDTHSRQLQTSTASNFVLAENMGDADAGNGARTVTGTGGADRIYAGSGNKTIHGNGGDDLIAVDDRSVTGDSVYIDGGAGADMLFGGRGNDIFIVDDLEDQVHGDAGIDEVRTLVDFLLGDDLENLVLLGSAAIGMGNALANRITGGSGATLLHGMGGDDTVSGGGSNDWLEGGAGNDRLDGGGGADRMEGGTGDDSYVVDHAGDRVTELAGEGNDRVRATVNFELGANVEDLVLAGSANLSGAGNALANALTGNGGNNWLVGLAGNDVIDGGLGGDRMEGGLDDDTYTVDNSLDRVNEKANEGTDRVFASITFELGANVENLTLTGAENLAGGGNALANVLTGNAGNNWLAGAGGNDVIDGGLGFDRMDGGAGDDSYAVDNTGDRVNEKAGEGVDSVTSAISYELGANVENLTLAGSANLNGGGNGLANTLIGNGGANWLAGAAGDDLVDGGLGSDRLDGGAGADIFRFSSALGAGNVDAIRDFVVADDTIQLDRSIFTGIAANGALAAGALRVGTAAIDADDRILYDAGTGNLWYDPDGVGGIAAVQFARAAAGLALTNADFFAVP